MAGDADRRPRVAITRSLPGARATATRLGQLGFRPEITPLFRIEPLPLPEPSTLAALSPGVPGLCVLTSQWGVRSLAAASDWRGDVVCVGEATAAHARAAGFTSVTCLAADATDLAARLPDWLAGYRADTHVFWVGAARPSVDLGPALDASGRIWSALALYDSVPDPEGIEALRESLTEVGGIDPLHAILFHSAEAARAAEPVLSGVWHDLSAPPLLIGISDKALCPLTGLGWSRLAAPNMLAAATPDEAGVLAMLQSTVKAH